MAPGWLADARLWLVLDRAAAAPRSLTKVTEQAVAGGVDAVVFRAKDLSPAEALPLAVEVRELCLSLEVPFVLSHFAELVGELSPDALHLGASDLEDLGQLAARRDWLPAEIALGYSAHSIAELKDAFTAGADYAFLGPVFATPSKLQYGPPLGLSVVDEAAQQARPVVFIGGINAETLPELVAAGGRRVAMISGILSVDNITAGSAQLHTSLQNATDQDTSS